MTRGSAVKSFMYSAVAWFLIAVEGLGCPLCEALSGTLSDDLRGASYAAIAKVRYSTWDPTSQLYRTTFQESGRLQVGGKPLPPRNQAVDILLLDTLKRDQVCLLLGYSTLCEREADREDHPPPAKQQQSEEVAWSIPQPLTEELKNYLLQMPSESEQLSRLIYFYDHLLSVDPVVRDDAYNECARTSLETIRSQPFRHHVDLEDISNRIANPDLSHKSKCFYWMLIAEFGGRDQLQLFDRIAIPEIEKQLQRSNPLLIDQPIWIAASIAAYCSVAARCGEGQTGLTRIEELILGNPNASPSIIYAAISAMRVVADDLKSVPVDRIAKSMEQVLRNPQSADLVIADLARWEHWDCLPTLITLFDDVTEHSSLVRVPIINFLRVCPLPEASQFLLRAKEADPQAYRRAFSILPSISKRESTRNLSGVSESE